MKKFLFSLLVVFTICIFPSNSLGDYTYNSHIDPKHFGDWLVVQVFPIPTNNIILYDIYLKNPVETDVIKYANVLVYESKIMQYYYLKDGKFYGFCINESSCYEDYKVTEEINDFLSKAYKEIFGIDSI